MPVRLNEEILREMTRRRESQVIPDQEQWLGLVDKFQVEREECGSDVIVVFRERSAWYSGSGFPVTENTRRRCRWRRSMKRIFWGLCCFGGRERVC